jgi:hypothetical protein
MKRSHRESFIELVTNPDVAEVFLRPVRLNSKQNDFSFAN